MSLKLSPILLGLPEMRVANTPVDQRVFSAGAFRERKGAIHSRVLASNLILGDTVDDNYQKYRKLTPVQYYELYKNTPDVRACIDSIARRVATWDWHVRPNIDPRDSSFGKANMLAAKCVEFMNRTNTSGDTWQDIMTRMVTDLMIYDAGVFELVYDEMGELEEIASFLGSEFFPVTDEHGRLLFYNQQYEFSSSSGTNDELPPKDIVYFRLFPNNRTLLGTPLLESLINECVTVLLAHEHAMLSLDADEIPPGLLILGGITGPAADRAKADLASMKGKDHKIRVITSSQPSAIEAKWLELRKTPKDLQMLDVVRELRRAIWRVFGVQPVELGVTEGMPRATANAQMDVATSHLITPILELISAKINTQIISKIVGEENRSLVKFSWDKSDKLRPDERLAESRTYGEYIKRGVMTVNEVRMELGLMPVDGGDTSIVETNVGPIPLKSLAENIIPRIVNSGAGVLNEDNLLPPEDEEPKADIAEVVEQNPEGLSIPFFGKCSHVDKSVDLDHIRAIVVDTPQEWIDSEFFGKNARMINLNKLGDLINAYSRSVFPLYVKFAEQTAASIRAEVGSWNETSPSKLKAMVNRNADRMQIEWGAATYRHYMDAALLGSRSSEKFSGMDADWKTHAAQYHNDAMGYLTGRNGLITKLRTSVYNSVDNITDPNDIADDVLRVFNSQAHRVMNWSGKLVHIANDVMHRGMMASESENNRWFVKWASVSDKRTCPECSEESSAAPRSLQTLHRRPTYGVRCGARCRCVLIYYKKDEV